METSIPAPRSHTNAIRATTRRGAGQWDPASPTGLSDHICWAYESAAERAELTIGWLGEGLRLGQRCYYIAEAPAEMLIADLVAMPEALTGLESGAVVVMSTDDVYDVDVPVDAAAQLSAYDEALNHALADGFSGLRVAADITSLVGDPARRSAHLRWEHVADRFMTGHPLAKLCLYDAHRIDDAESIACVHPLHGPGERPFGLFAGGPARAVLTGELDACAADALTDALRALPAGDAVIDLTNLTFIDARSAWVLQDELSRRHAAGQQIRLAEPSRQLHQIWQICGFDEALLPV